MGSYLGVLLQLSEDAFTMSNAIALLDNFIDNSLGIFIAISCVASYYNKQLK